MQILIRNQLVCFLACLIFGNTMVWSQPTRIRKDRFKAKDRISTMKKIKLLEVLNLDEEKASRFIAKFSAWEKKIEAQHDMVEEAGEDLSKALNKDNNESEIVKLTDVYLKEKGKMLNLTNEMNDDFKTFLGPVNFAKYLIFEERFRQEIGRALFEHRMDKRHRPPDEDE